ncbi:MAG: hypothetical protein ILP16_02625 [Spirochaetales bacterium]|nr:hypothetical protein [Spirochaetales bacterium]
MTRKLVILFVVLMVCFGCLISSFWGERGFLANNELKRQLKENEYKLDKSDVEIEVLQKQEEDTATVDGLRVSGMRYGSAAEGDEVYVFENKDEVETIVTTSTETEDTNARSFKPLKLSLILLISSGSSFIITMLVFILSKRKGAGDDPQQEESGDIGNNLYDN